MPSVTSTSERSAGTRFVGSTTSNDRVRDDALGPGQRFAVAAIEVCSRILVGDKYVNHIPNESSVVLWLVFPPVII